MTKKMNHGQPNINQPMPSFEAMPYGDDEIDLRELFFTLWLRKKFIGLGVLIFVIAAAGIAFSMPGIYRIKALVSPSIVSRVPGEHITFTNSLESVKGQIDAGVYNMRMVAFVEDKFPGMRYSPKALRVTIPKKSSTLLISYDTPNPDFGKAVMSQLIEQLKVDDAKTTEPFIEGLQDRIESSKKVLTEFEKRKTLVSSHLKDRNKTKIDIEQQIIIAVNSTDGYRSNGVESIASSKIAADSLYKVLVYNNMVIQTRQVLSDLRKELNEVNAQIGSLEQQQQSTSDLYSELQARVWENARKIENIIPFQELIPAIVEEELVGPKRRLIVLMTFVTGLFFMICVTFIIEYVKPVEK